MSRLADYFGAVGMTSVIAAAVGIVLLVVFSVSRWRTYAYYAAVVLAVASVVLAYVNRSNVRAFEVDWSAEQKAQQEARMNALRAQGAMQAADVRFVEDNPDDKYDLAGVKVKVVEDPNASGDTAPGYAYRQRGRQERAAGSTRQLEGMESFQKEEPKDTVRRLPIAEVNRATLWAELNVDILWAVLGLCVALLLFDYFSRFNRTFRDYLPLPITGCFVDRHFPKAHSVWVGAQTKPRVRELLEHCVRKGESFVYFGQEDPWPQRLSLPRIDLGGPLKIWALKKIVIGADTADVDDEFIYESAWFGRYCFVILGDTTCHDLLNKLKAFLAFRRFGKARARRTFNIVWNRPDLLSDTLQEELRFGCKETNLRLIICDSHAGDAPAGVFDEVHA